MLNFLYFFDISKFNIISLIDDFLFYSIELKLTLFFIWYDKFLKLNSIFGPNIVLIVSFKREII